MPHGTQACYFDSPTRLLHIQSSHGAWQVRLWPDPQLVHIAGTRVPFQPPLYLELGSLLAPKTPVLVSLALAARTVPERVRACVIAFAPASEQFGALQAIHDVPELVSLLNERPVLGRLACAQAMDAVARQALSALLQAASGHRGRRQALLEWLKMPRAGAFTKALSKAVHPASWLPEDVRDLADWWQQAPKDVQHLAVVSPAQVRLWRAAHERGLYELLTPQLLQALQQHRDLVVRDDLCQALDQIAAHAARSGRRVKPCRTPVDLCHRLLETVSEVPSERLDGPPRSELLGVHPPVACPSWIEPLGTSAAHAGEGVEMEHCLEDEEWFSKQARGEGYAFSARHRKGRSTVWLKATRQPGVFELEELRGPLNELPDLEIRHDVQGWLASHNAWAAHLHHGQPRPMGKPVCVPQAAVAFSTESRSLVCTLIRVAHMARIGDRRPQRPAMELEELQTAILDHLPAPRTLEQDVRDGILPAQRAARASGEQLARLVEQLEPELLDGRTLDKDGVSAVLEQMYQLGAVLTMFGAPAKTPAAWPPQEAAYAPDTAEAVARDSGDVPF